jgi:hypothetical protein
MTIDLRGKVDIINYFEMASEIIKRLFEPACFATRRRGTIGRSQEKSKVSIILKFIQSHRKTASPTGTFNQAYFTDRQDCDSAIGRTPRFFSVSSEFTNIRGEY